MLPILLSWVVISLASILVYKSQALWGRRLEWLASICSLRLVAFGTYLRAHKSGPAQVGYIGDKPEKGICYPYQQTEVARNIHKGPEN